MCLEIFSRQSNIVVALISALALDAHAIGLLDLYRDAVRSDPVYAAARAERKAADSLVAQARGQLLPQAAVSWSNIKNDQTVSGSNTLGRFNRNYEFDAQNSSLNLSLALFRPQLWAAYTQAGAQVVQAEGAFRSAEQDLIIRLSQAYFDISLAEDNLALSGEQKAAISEQLKQAKRYFEAGLGTVTDINEAQARFDTVVAQEIAAQSALEIKVRALEQVVGAVHRHLGRLGRQFVLEMPEPAAIERWLEFAQSNNPLLRSKQAALEVAEKEVYKAASAHLPTVDLVAGRSRSIDPSYTMINTESWNTTLGVQMTMPLFSGGTTQGRVNQVAALREKATFDYEASLRSVNLATRQEFLNVVNGVAQVKALEQAVRSNEVALYSAQKGQEAGMRTSFDVLNAQQLLFTAKRDLAQARYTYVLARLKLRSAAGLLGEEDVELVDQWLAEPR